MHEKLSTSHKSITRAFRDSFKATKRAPFIVGRTFFIMKINANPNISISSLVENICHV